MTEPRDGESPASRVVSTPAATYNRRRLKVAIVALLGMIGLMVIWLLPSGAITLPAQGGARSVIHYGTVDWLTLTRVYHGEGAESGIKSSKVDFDASAFVLSCVMTAALAAVLFVLVRVLHTPLRTARIQRTGPQRALP